MDPGHRASGHQSLSPSRESPERRSRAVNGLSRFLNRTMSTSSLNSLATRLPRYSILGSQQSILDQEVDDNSTLRDDDLYTHSETAYSQRTSDDGDTRTLVEGSSLPDNSHIRASVASVSPPRYSFTPPRYSGVFGIAAEQVKAEGVTCTEHTYNICNGLKNKPWVTFLVFSQPLLGVSQKHQKFPRYSGGDMITGLIELTLDSPQTVNSITVSLRGHVIRGHLAGEADTFLDHQVSIWTRTAGDPRFPNLGSTKRFDGKLKGPYQFPFAFPFPAYVDISTSTAINFPPLQTPSDPDRTSSGSSPSSEMFSSTSSPFPHATTPRLKSAASVHTGTNPQFTGSHSSGMSGQRKKSLNQERHPNEFHPFPDPNAPEESEKVRLKRLGEEQDRALAQLVGNSSDSLPVHVYPTPQTFLEHGIHANVQYELGLHITHGMLRPTSKLKTAIVYTPSITPPPASVARQLAYNEGASLPGPAADPDGWQTLPKVMVHGELWGHRNVEVECTLSLAKPLCYTRGAVIPCYLTLECSNSHALGLLSTPKSPLIRLTRRVRYSQDVSSTINNGSNESPTPFGILTDNSVAPADDFSGSSRVGGRYVNLISGAKCGDMIQGIEEVELAIWWIPQKDVPQEMYLKRLEGEIHLAKDLQPTCKFLPFSVEYVVEMLPLVSHVFEPIHSKPEWRLLIQPVEIATHHPEGPMPTTFTEPPSDRERERRKKVKREEKAEVEIIPSPSPVR